MYRRRTGGAHEQVAGLDILVVDAQRVQVLEAVERLREVAARKRDPSVLKCVPSALHRHFISEPRLTAAPRSIASGWHNCTLTLKRPRFLEHSKHKPDLNFKCDIRTGGQALVR